MLSAVIPREDVGEGMQKKGGRVSSLPKWGGSPQNIFKWRGGQVPPLFFWRGGSGTVKEREGPPIEFRKVDLLM
jgi:hypothetical protein